MLKYVHLNISVYRYSNCRYTIRPCYCAQQPTKCTCKIVCEKRFRTYLTFDAIMQSLSFGHLQHDLNGAKYANIYLKKRFFEIENEHNESYPWRRQQKGLLRDSMSSITCACQNMDTKWIVKILKRTT